MIEVRDLAKSYGPVTALKGISFSVPKGQVLGLLGPNGAGKTTTMKILTGYLAPTSGTATVAGHDVTSDPLPCQRRIGYLPEGNPLYGDLRVDEALKFAAEMHGLRGRERDDAVDRSVQTVALGDKRRRTTGTMSRGERQRVGLAQALLHEPDVLVLDEPTSGLDPNQQQEMRHLIRELGRQRTVILSTHILPEVEAVCDRALIISQGLIVADGTVEEIRQRARGKAAVVVAVRASPEAAQAAFASLPGVESVEATAVADEPGVARARVVGAADRAACERIAARAAERGLPLSSLSPDVASLERIFAELTTGAEDAAAAGKN
jgi:ABC-2 type transport system ATP-binding protein